MHGFGVVPQSLLGEPLGVSTLARPLGPGVAVGVQANPFDAEARAALLEFRGPVATADRPQIRKERAGLGSPLEEGGDCDAESDEGRFDFGSGARFQFLAGI